MRHDKTSEQIQETAALYALGALGSDEAQAFEAHLEEGCAICRQELARFEATAAGLALGATEIEPPARIREALLSEIQDSRRGLAAVTTHRPLAVWRFVPWAAAAIFAFLTILSFQAMRQSELARESERDEARAALEELRAELTSEQQRSRELETLQAALASAGSRVIRLQGQPAAPGASAVIVWDTQRNQWVAWARLPAAPSQKVYQLWMVTREARISAGLMDTDPTGASFAVFDISGNVSGIAAAAITLEPAGGSAQPTLPIYALGAVPRL